MLLLVACSKQQGMRQLEVTKAAISNDDIDGGVLIKMTNPATSQSTIVTLSSPPYEVAIPNGSWLLEVIAFAGPANWSGTIYCASKTVNLADSDDSINFTVSTSCSSPNYQSIITTKVALWNVSNWDTGLWAP
jgi:hypothetical protein